MGIPNPAIRKKRRVLPRWRDRQTSVNLREAEAVNQRLTPRVLELDSLNIDLERFSSEPSTAFAAELVGRAVAIGNAELALPASEYLQRNRDLATPPSVNLAMWALGERQNIEAFDPARPILDSAFREYQSIAQLKARLKTYPRDALLWLDLARQYTTLGQRGSADRAVLIALGLHPNHRIVLRAATRFYINKGEIDHALDLLHRSPATPRDPWLIAAELAISSMIGEGSRPPRFVRQARAFINDDNIQIFHRSELAASLATLELGVARARHVKNLFNLALVQPTENALAQAQWARVLAPTVVPEIEADDFERTQEPYEALAWLHRLSGEHNSALIYSRSWVHDEPFRTEPLLFAAYESHLVGGEPAEPVALMQRAQRLRPNSWLILNNLAFYLILNSGNNIANINTANGIMDQAEKLDVDSFGAITLHATRGFVKFAEGKPTEGRNAYQLALSLMLTSDLKREVEWNLLANLARAEYHYGNIELGRQALTRAQTLVENSSEALVKKAVENVSTIFARPRSNS
jgi:Flp pilus assembly protein TadD